MIVAPEKNLNSLSREFQLYSSYKILDQILLEGMFTGLGDLSLVIDPRSNICHSAPEKTADAISSNLIQENNAIFPRMSKISTK
jgi:hypothetical protein